MDNNSYLILLIKEYINNTIHSITQNFNFELYTIEEEKINNLSICANMNIEISSPIVNSDLMNYDKALILSKQGYDIYNYSSNFYYDVFLSAHINDSDLILNARKKYIYPNNISLCQKGCSYNGINFKTKRINCICNIDSLNSNKDNNYFMEEV